MKILLPLELLSTIIEYAAECDSTYDSYKEHLRALSSLSLVSRTVHDFAQPLLTEKVYCTTREQLEGVLQGNVAEKVKSLAYDQGGVFSKVFSKILKFSSGFANLTELRVSRGVFDLSSLTGHQHLAKFGTFGCELGSWAGLVLPQLVELSIYSVIITDSALSSGDNLLSISRFPSLRALALRSVMVFSPGEVEVSVNYSIARQLECMVADRMYPVSSQTDSLQPLSLPLPNVVPLLYDLHPSPTWESWERQAFSKTHVRIPLCREPVREPEEIETALTFMEALLDKSTILEELYVDLWCREGRGGDGLDKELAARIEKLESQAREKEVEIIWENYEVDWCRSLVSKEFWRRSKETKEMKKGEGNQE
ncbi:uncharacterized protein JCM6883_003806 [Sporobolomyces salmoneus]|uniref:uncharacterized protein n=1 Tax=Sporobolomyces salmoneus TaxID=183962 RepID=UPI00317AD274